MEPLLQRLHGGADDYEVVVPEALLEQSRQTQRIFNIVNQWRAHLRDLSRRACRALNPVEALRYE